MVIYDDNYGVVICHPFFFKIITKKNQKLSYSWMAFLNWFWPTWIIFKVFRKDLSSPVITKNGDFLFFFNGKLWRIDALGKKKKYKNFNCNRPLKVFYDKYTNALFFGDYISNKNREKEVFLYKYDVSNSIIEKINGWNDIRHIHGVIGIGTDKILVLCGDYQEEARMILLNKMSYEEITSFKGNDQLNRAVDAIYHKESNSIYYGMDTQLEQNYLCSLDLANGSINRIIKLDGPSFNMKIRDKCLYFTVSCEIGLPNLSEIQLCSFHLENNNFNKLFSHKLPFKLNKFIQTLLGIPTLNFYLSKENILIINNFNYYFFKKSLYLKIDN